MAIFIRGKTTCRICRQVLTSGAHTVGFPNWELPAWLGELADRCTHRSCLDAHSQRDDLLQAWEQHWKAQTKQAGTGALVNQHGLVIFKKRTFTFVALDTFVEIEDQVEVFDQLRIFFSSFDGHERLSTATAWNTYVLERVPSRIRLLITANPAPATAPQTTWEGPMLEYEFIAERWAGFACGWQAGGSSKLRQWTRFASQANPERTLLNYVKRYRRHMP